MNFDLFSPFEIVIANSACICMPNFASMLSHSGYFCLNPTHKLNNYPPLKPILALQQQQNAGRCLMKDRISLFLIASRCFLPSSL